MRQFVIACDQTLEDVYWSNEWGWTSRSECTVFEEEELEVCDLPVGGYWVDAETGERYESA